ncbi:hypothetical protein PAHAL_6G006100 [Panicum hallii]|jgi:hypothetical protein|uniref:DUF1618 domain-containing protein n=1 Tax=Panicum hallii TaxID=206008 RepID=A0A2S3HZJ2_9POAL|nr:uncharacterized protein LOC112896267 [Panicum hallii]PAN33255.1 hypothetical protein PAHAL_6G006100 [Panicum hallii]
MSDKRRRQNQRAGGGHKRRRPHKHLYLVLDDWEKGFSIHKIDADRFHSDSDSDSDSDYQHLPEPPALRLEPPVSGEPYCDVSFATLGTKIFAFMNQRCGLAYDAETGVLSMGAHAPAQMVCGYGISIAVGDVLYVLTYRYDFDRQHPHSFEAMSSAPTAPEERQHPTEGWTWKTLPPPAFHSCVHSYALHPDGRTIFMTSSYDTDKMGTYSFDTKDSTWRFHGNWVLPFSGQGHFDAELDAWVGLDQYGYICSCPVISPSFQCTAPCFYPDCKMTEEKIFAKRHMRATLTYMGATKFCLVDCVNNRSRDAYEIRLTMFGLKYSYKGELQITDHRSTCSFMVSRHTYHFVPLAFWM